MTSVVLKLLRVTIVLATIAALQFPPASARSAFEALPSATFISAPLITPDDAAGYYGAAASPAAPIGRDPLIQTLARELDYDPDRIFDFVHNAIDTTPLFGLQKGAYGAALDQAGTPFDQAHLMIELLRESGFEARYVYGDISVSGAEFSSWLGPRSSRGACELLSNGGIPAKINALSSVDCSSASYSSADGSLSSVTMLHAWVEANIDGAWYAFDPSFKHYQTWEPDSASLANLPSSSTLRTAAGGVVGELNGVAKLSGYDASQLDDTLAQASGDLLDALDADPDRAGLSLHDVVGGRRIISELRADTNQELREPAISHQSLVRDRWSGDVPINMRTQVEISVFSKGGIEQTPKISLSTDASMIAGRRLMLVPHVFGAHWIGEGVNISLTLDGETIGTYQRLGQDLGNGRTAPLASHPIFVMINVDFPYAVDDGCGSGTLGCFGDEEFLLLTSNLSRSVIVQSWGERATTRQLHTTRELSTEGYYTKAALQNIQTNAPSVGRAGGQPIVSDAYWGIIHNPNNVAPQDCTAENQCAFGWKYSVAAPGISFTGADYLTFEDAVQEATQSSLLQTKSRVADNFIEGADELARVYEALGYGRIVAHCFIGLATSAITLGEDGRVREDQLAIDIRSRLSYAQHTDEGSSVATVADAYTTALSALERAAAQAETKAPYVNSTTSMFDWFTRASPTSAQTPIEFLIIRSAQDYQAISGDLFAYSVSSQLPTFTDWADGHVVVAPRSGRLGPHMRAVRILTEYGSTGPQYEGSSSWSARGTALLSFTQDPNRLSVSHLATPACSALIIDVGCINSLMKGAGGVTFPDTIMEPRTDTEFLDEQYETWARSFDVDLRTGGLTFAPPPDIETGSGGYPYSLAFQRTYNSDRDRGEGPLSWGWTHNFDIRLAPATDLRAALGDNSAKQTVATIVAAKASLDLFDDTPTGDDVARAGDFIVDALVQHWCSDQLFENSVVITRGSGSERFFRVPTGTGDVYVPEAGSTASLTLSSGSRTIDGFATPYSEHTADVTWQGYAYRVSTAFDYSTMEYFYQSADGVKETYVLHDDDTYSTPFDGLAAGGYTYTLDVGSSETFRPISTEFPFGVTLTYEYAGALLDAVSSNFGDRRLNFAYEANPGRVEKGSIEDIGGYPRGAKYRLASVTDENGRSVSFAYDTTCNIESGFTLASVTSVDQELTTYRYDQILRAPYDRPAPYTPAGSTACGNFGDILTGADLYADKPLLTAVRLPAAPTSDFFTIAYDQFGRVESVTNAEGETWTYGAGSGRTGFSRDPLGNTTWSAYDQDGRLAAALDPRSRLTTTRYDGIGRTIETRLRWASDPDVQYHARSTFTYDAFNNQVAACTFPRTNTSGAPIGGTSLSSGDRALCANDPDAMFGATDPGAPRVSETEFGYAAFPTLPTRAIDPRGNATDYCYDPAQGGVCTSVPALTANGPDGLLRGTFGPSGEEALVDYDVFGRPVHTWTRVN